MTISLVQAPAAGAAPSLAAVGSGNTVYFGIVAFAFSNATITSSAPTIGGSPVSGATKILDQLSGFSGTGVVYIAVWKMPNVTGAPSGTCGITIGGGGTLLDIFPREYSGMGASPTVDQLVTVQHPNAPNPAAGPTGAITSAPELVIMMSAILGVAEASPGSPWTYEAGSSSFCGFGWQVVTSSGGTYSFTQSTSGGQNAWSAGIVTDAASGGGGTAHTATAALTVTPSFSAGRQRGKFRTGALSVVPSLSAVRARGRFRTAALSVDPSIAAGRAQGHTRRAALLVTPGFTAARSAGHVRHAVLVLTPVIHATGTNVTPVPPTPPGAKPATGAWWGLDAILQSREEEFTAWESIVQVSGGLACPVCGEPLQTGPPSAAGTVAAYCPFAGDHKYHVPRDVVPPRRGVKMGRFG